MLDLNTLPEFAAAYSNKQFRHWYDCCVRWVERNGLNAEVMATESHRDKDVLELHLRIHLTDSEGAFFAGVFPLRRAAGESDDAYEDRVDHECSAAVSSARKARMAAFTGREPAARVA